MRKVPEKRYEENQNTYVQITFSFSENRSLYEIMWKNNVEPHRPQMNTWRMRIACWTPKATSIDSQYLIYDALIFGPRFKEIVEATKRSKINNKIQ
jgi:hypothetical protein